MSKVILSSNICISAKTLRLEKGAVMFQQLQKGNLVFYKKLDTIDSWGLV